MKKIYILLCFLGFGLGLQAQQDSHFSQYMFNHLALNPAYAGSWGHATANLIYRKQWVNIDGAPTTQTFTLHAPSRNERHGFGFSFYNDQIGVTRNTHVNLSYAYRIPLGKTARLAFGLNGAVENYNSGFSEVSTGSSITGGGVDPSFSSGLNFWLPNVGAGVFFSSEHFFMGLSTPDILENDLDGNDAIEGAAESRHYFVSTGFITGTEDSPVRFKPSALLKYQPTAPWGLDLNAQFLLNNKLWLGASWRIDDAVVGMIQWQAGSWFRIGYAYDYPISDLADYTSGSHEFLLGLDLNFFRKGMVSPRWF